MTNETNAVSTKRLREIAQAIADGNANELTMRVPAEPGRDADLVVMSAADELDRLRARVAELEAERADDDALRERMSDILKRTAIALRGPEPPLTAWSWHDLPERAAAAIASIDLFQRVAHNLADTPAKDGVELIDGCDCTCSVVQSAHGHHAGCPAKDGAP